MRILNKKWFLSKLVPIFGQIYGIFFLITTKGRVFKENGKIALLSGKHHSFIVEYHHLAPGM